MINHKKNRRSETVGEVLLVDTLLVNDAFRSHREIVRILHNLETNRRNNPFPDHTSNSPASSIPNRTTGSNNTESESYNWSNGLRKNILIDHSHHIGSRIRGSTPIHNHRSLNTVNNRSYTLHTARSSKPERLQKTAPT